MTLLIKKISSNSFLVLPFDTEMSHLKRRWKVLRANQCYDNLPFISINVSFGRTVSLQTFPWIFPHSNFIKKKYYNIRCIKWCKCLICASCTLNTSHISSFTVISGSTISPSSVVKLFVVSVCYDFAQGYSMKFSLNNNQCMGIGKNGEIYLEGEKLRCVNCAR